MKKDTKPEHAPTVEAPFPMEPRAFVDWLYGPECGGSTARPWAVLIWAARLEWKEGRTFWAVIRETWPLFDRIPHRDFQRAFRYFKPFAPRDGLPERLTVYRGQAKTAPLGLSWTTSRTVAKSFARGHRGLSSPEPAIYSLKVTARQIAFLSNDREEREVVLFNVPRRTARSLAVSTVDLTDKIK